MRFRLAIHLVTMTLLSGCTMHRSLSIEYEPQPQAISGLDAVSFDVAVIDQRPYVVQGRKSSGYLGTIKGLVGEVYDVVGRHRLTLADQVARDLRLESAALHMRVASAPARHIRVKISEWNFSASVNTHFWYDVEVSVLDAQDRVLADVPVRDDQRVPGNALTRAKFYLEDDILDLYAGFIRKLVRENPPVIEALRPVP